MTRSLLIDEETGTSTRRYHPHNGYHSGDFFSRPETRVRSAQPRTGQAPLQRAVLS